MKAIKNFIFFYIEPHKEVLKDYTPLERLKNVGVLLIFNWLLLIFGGVLINTLFIELGVLDEPISKDKILHSLETAVLLAGIIAPVVEELTSRVWLVYSKFNLSIALATVAGVVVFKFVLRTDLSHPFNSWQNLSIILGVVGLTFVLAMRLFQNSKIAILLKRHVRLLAIISGIVFGYLHLFNYKVNFNLLIFSPLVLFNYIMGGFILGFIRVRYGFLYCILFHVIYNLLFILIKYR